MIVQTCKGCGSRGFDASVLGPDRCTFCDGTEGGNPPCSLCHQETDFAHEYVKGIFVCDACAEQQEQWVREMEKAEPLAPPLPAPPDTPV